jgi:hypothetical protein
MTQNPKAVPVGIRDTLAVEALRANHEEESTCRRNNTRNRRLFPRSNSTSRMIRGLTFAASWASARPRSTCGRSSTPGWVWQAPVALEEHDHGLRKRLRARTASWPDLTLRSPTDVVLIRLDHRRKPLVAYRIGATSKFRNRALFLLPMSIRKQKGDPR